MVRTDYEATERTPYFLSGPERATVHLYLNCQHLQGGGGTGLTLVVWSDGLTNETGDGTTLGNVWNRVVAAQERGEVVDLGRTFHAAHNTVGVASATCARRADREGLT